LRCVGMHPTSFVLLLGALLLPEKTSSNEFSLCGKFKLQTLLANSSFITEPSIQLLTLKICFLWRCSKCAFEPCSSNF
jgi:hypothetical protein